MSNPPVASYELGRPGVSTPRIDKCAMVAFSVCAFALIVDPVLIFLATGGQRPPEIMAPRLVPRFFWPTMAVISVLLGVQNRTRFSKLTWPPHIICLLLYLAFAGASVLWAFSPDRSFARYTQQVMVITSIFLPVMLTDRTVDIMRGLFLCFAFSLMLNLLFVLGGSVTIAQYGSRAVDIGYEGYFLGKNYLGECAVLALLLALDETRHRGWRRAFGTIVVVIAILLTFLSDSKTALGLALVVPFLARFTLIVRKITRISPAIILLCIPLCYIVISSVSHFNMNRVSYMLYGDSTLTGRTVIWDFVQHEIDRRSLVGWGYQSFWFVPGSPALTEAPGWVKLMPNAHNGYYDTTLEMGHIGLILLLVFILATLHAIGRVADRDPARARLLLTLALFIICYNYFESLWMRGYEFLWVIFVFVAVDISRYWQPVPLRRTAYRSRSPESGGPGPLPGVQAHRLRARLS
jgi:exopolysaccharide production protein ExoQ